MVIFEVVSNFRVITQSLIHIHLSYATYAESSVTFDILIIQAFGPIGKVDIPLLDRCLAFFKLSVEKSSGITAEPQLSKEIAKHAKAARNPGEKRISEWTFASQAEKRGIQQTTYGYIFSVFKLFMFIGSFSSEKLVSGYLVEMLNGIWEALDWASRIKLIETETVHVIPPPDRQIRTRSPLRGRTCRDVSFWHLHRVSEIQNITDFLSLRHVISFPWLCGTHSSFLVSRNTHSSKERFLLAFLPLESWNPLDGICINIGSRGVEGLFTTTMFWKATHLSLLHVLNNDRFQLSILGRWPEHFLGTVVPAGHRRRLPGVFLFSFDVFDGYREIQRKARIDNCERSMFHFAVLFCLLQVHGSLSDFINLLSFRRRWNSFGESETWWAQWLEGF